MPAISYTETSVADDVVVHCTRFRVNPSTLDWRVQLQCSVVAANGDVIKTVDVDAATLLSAGQMTTFKNMLNTGIGILATNRSVTTNV